MSGRSLLTLAALSLGLALPGAAAADTLFVVRNTSDSGVGSLRQAITNANLASGTDEIEFRIPGRGLKIIKPLTPLPNITGPVEISGYTQRGARRNAARLGTSARLRIVLSGANLSGADAGLRILAPESLVEGLVVNRFQGPQIELGSGSSSSWIRGSFLGVNAAGTAAASAGGASNDGVDVESSDNLIGGRARAHRNLISGNRADGVEIDTGGSGNVVRGNLIGTGRAGGGDLGNRGNGVLVEDASNTIVGGKNVISGNGGHGVFLAGTSNTVRGNRIGTNASGRRDVGNRGAGVNALGNDLLVGGPRPRHRNLISGNGGDGVVMAGTGGAEGIVVQGNYIGTNAAGKRAIPNDGDGIEPVSGSSSLRIGGPVSTPGRAPGNVVSGNRGDGIHVEALVTGVEVDGNLVGTNARGSAAVPNRRNGLAIWSGTNGTITGANGPNVVSGNRNAGVLITGTTNNAVLYDSRIGTNRAGTAPVPNGVGVDIRNTGSHSIGDAGRGNVISGNRGPGIWIHGQTSAIVVLANLVGLGADGKTPVPNGRGIVVAGEASPNYIGFTGAPGNVVAGNRGPGIVLESGSGGTRPDGTVIAENRIGVTGSGKARPNGGHGILIDGAVGSRIGDTDAGNTIGHNRGAGVRIVSGTGNSVFANSIYANRGLGIDLARSGTTPNDPDDPDGGANNRQNHPVIRSVSFAGGVTTVEGRLNSVPSATFVLEFFKTRAPRARAAEARTSLGSMLTVTNANGDASFSFEVMGRISDVWLRATATRTLTLDTSELGPARRVP